MQEASHVGDTGTALEELQRLISQKKEWSNNGNKTKKVTTFDVQVADFIRNHKKNRNSNRRRNQFKSGYPFTLDADGIEDLCNMDSGCWNFYHR